MKTLHLAILSLFACNLLTSCKNPDTGKVSVVTTAQKSKPFVRPSASALGVALLAVTPKQEDKLSRAKWLFAVATVIRTISSDHIPTEEEFKLALTAITPTEQNDWLQVVVGLSSVYAGFRAQAGPDTVTVFGAIEQLALGLEDAARPYVKTV